MANRRGNKQRQNRAIQAIAGLGLILIGVALGFLLRPAPAEANAVAPEDRSVVPVAVHYPAPALALEDSHGSKASLADYQHSIVLVNNWATWCPPCKAEMPTLEAYYEQHKQEGLVIIGIEAGDSKGDVQSFAQAYGLTFPIWLDPGNASLAAFRNENLPNSYVLDRSGIVRYAWTGEISQAMLEKFVTPLLQQSQ